MRNAFGKLAAFSFISGMLLACGSSEPKSACKADEVFVGFKCLKDIEVGSNGVGYLTSRVKKASFQGDLGAFELIDAESGDSVYSGEADGPIESRDTQEMVYSADFSDFSKPGSYYVLTGAGQKSAVFEIGDSSLARALDTAMLGMYSYRCGVEVELDHGEDHFQHGACHLKEAELSRISSEDAATRDDTGGWHDAGDYGKYVRNGAFAVALLLRAYEDFPEFLREREFEIPEKGGALPDILDESRVELEWILKTQFSDGSFAHKVTALNFEGNILPENDAQKRYFFSTATSSTADAVAALAQAARIFEEFDAKFAAKCLAAAEQGQAFLDANTEEISSDQSGANTGTYGSNGDKDERAWALAELWETTGDAKYLAPLEQLLPGVGVGNEFDWANVGNLAVVTYLRSSKSERDSSVIASLQAELGQSALTLSDAALGDVYGRDTTSYYWGSNGVVARSALNLATAHRENPNTDFLDTITLQLDYLLGLNPFKRSMVTGLGGNPVRSPHHRPSVADAVAAPWPGLLIGGPHNQGSDICTGPSALCWQDDADNYRNNEVAINWNTALIYALVAALATESDTSADCWPDDCLPSVDGGMGGAPNGGTAP